MTKANAWWLKNQPVETANRYLAMCIAASPWVEVFDYLTTTPVLLSDPATLPTGAAVDIDFRPGSSMYAVAHANSPYVSFYSISGTTITKLADPATLPTDDCSGVRFSPDGNWCLTAGPSAGLDLNLYDMSSGAPVWARGLSKGSTTGAIAWGPDSAVFCHDAAGQQIFYDPTDFSVIDTVSAGGSSRSMDWDPLSNLILQMRTLSGRPVGVIDWNAGVPTVLADPVADNGGSTGISVRFDPSGTGICITTQPDVGADPKPYTFVYDCSSGVPVAATTQLSPQTQPSSATGACIRDKGDKIAITSPSATHAFLMVFQAFVSEAGTPTPSAGGNDGSAWGGSGGTMDP
tara:strand:- start:314 stop:1354 length:1041 start_codon:yes stop_codon:yes gene_type:complete